jgi:hypothetical protein
MWSSRASLVAATLAFGLAAAPAVAEEAVDGSKPLICATLQAVSCTPGEECDRGLPESVGAPQFLRVDFEKKVVVGPKRTTPVLHQEADASQITLQGFELGMGWSLAIDRATGKAVITFASADEGIVIFTACTAQ